MQNNTFRIIDLIKYAFKDHPVHAIRIAIQSIFGAKQIKARFKKNSQPICLRNRSSDITTFKQVFIWQEYAFPIQGAVQTIVDAGANIGCASCWFSSEFPEATLIAIEPEASNFERLKINTAGISRITCLQKALWNIPTKLHLTNPSAEKWNYRYEEAVSSEKQHALVETISVPDLMKQHQLSGIDILKLDIEGAEKNVFEAGTEMDWLKKVRYLFIETHDFMVPGSAKAVTTALFGYAFDMHLCGENLVFVNREWAPEKP